MYVRKIYMWKKKIHFTYFIDDIHSRDQVWSNDARYEVTCYYFIYILLMECQDSGFARILLTLNQIYINSFEVPFL